VLSAGGGLQAGRGTTPAAFVAPPPDAEYRLQQEELAAGRWPVGAGCAAGGRGLRMW
jgi:hypothetical protein